MEVKLSKTALAEPETRQAPQQEARARQEVSIKDRPVVATKTVVNLTKLKQQTQKQQDSRVVSKNQINFFGGQIEEEKKPIETPVMQQEQTAATIEKPNYDFIKPLSSAQQKKIFKIEKAASPSAQKRSSALMKKIKIATFAILFAVLGSWTIYNAVEITQYDLKLGQYLTKLGTLDSASNLNDLFPTYPEDGEGAAGMAKQSNWFDRFCNFIGGIFGG